MFIKEWVGLDTCYSISQVESTLDSTHQEEIILVHYGNDSVGQREIRIGILKGHYLIPKVHYLGIGRLKKYKGAL